MARNDEPGTGKELVAREIHNRSPRHKRPMIRVNCASIPKELYESEFFGHVKGAFTGAIKDRAGRFQLADGGTLFLDEIGEVPLDLQSKLLRVLQEGTYERVGGEQTYQANVRVIAATNKNLKEEADAGGFRQALYYRLNVFPIEVPPLRSRSEDIPMLASRFISDAASRLNLPAPRLTQAHLAQLQNYDWPGNIRELQNVIERAVIIARSGKLSFHLTGGKPRGAGKQESADETQDRHKSMVHRESEMNDKGKENILSALRQCRWKVSGPGGAAEMLAMKPTTLYSRIKKLGLKKPDHPPGGGQIS